MALPLWSSQKRRPNSIFGTALRYDFLLLLADFLRALVPIFPSWLTTRGAACGFAQLDVIVMTRLFGLVRVGTRDVYGTDLI